MKSLIGFIFDISCEMKNQFSNIKIDITDDMICPYFPFISLLSKTIDDKFDIFIGSCGVDLNFGKVCDIISLLKYISENDLLPKIDTYFGNHIQYKNAFIEKLTNTHTIRYIAEQELSEDKCKYLFLAFNNYQNIYDEIGNEESKLEPDQSILNVILQKIFPIFKTIREIVYDKHKLKYDMLINDLYRTLINNIFFRVLNNYNWNEYLKEYCTISPSQLTDILFDVYQKMPPECQNSIYDAINTFFFSFSSFLNISLNAAFNTFQIKEDLYYDRNLIIISNGTSSQEALNIANNMHDDIKVFCCYLNHSQKK